MSHTLRKVNLGNTAICQVTITNYVAGGEAFTLAELGLTGSVTGVFQFEIVQSRPANPVVGAMALVSGLLVLYVDAEMLIPFPTINGLNFTFFAFVTGT